MTKTKASDATANETAETIDGQEEIPDWATRPVDQSEVAVFVPPSDSQARRKLQSHELIEYVAAQVNTYDDDDPRIALEIAAQIAASSTVEDVLTGGETTKGRTILDTILEVDAIKFSVSQEQGGCPFFALISGRNTTDNSRDVVSIGGWRTVLQLAQLHYMAATLPTGSPFLVPDETPDSIAQESYPFYFKIRQTDVNAKGRQTNYLAHPMS